MFGLLTPARVSALFWVAVLALLVWQTLSAEPLTRWTDPVDSVAVLTKPRACEVARKAVSTPEARCVRVEASTSSALVELENGPTVCLLKAGRWFVVDQGLDIECPNAPLRSVRVTSWKEESAIELEWRSQVEGARLKALQHELRANLLDGLKLARGGVVPANCPEFEPAEVHVLDADLIARRGQRPWHFLSSDALEKTLDPAASAWTLETNVRNFQDESPWVVLVDSSLKVHPKNRTAGSLEATVTLINWKTKQALCGGSLQVVQPADLDLDHGARGFPQAAPEQVLTMDFKERVFEGLEAVVGVLGHGALTVERTW